MHWRMHAYSAITKINFQKKQKPGQKLQASWITENKYKESIMEIVGKAIADCVTDMNAFNYKNAAKIIKLKFEEMPEAYEQKHWNSVMLWNYVACKWRRQDYNTVINEVKETYETYFSSINRPDKKEALKEFVEKAVWAVNSYRSGT